MSARHPRPLHDFTFAMVLLAVAVMGYGLMAWLWDVVEASIR